MINSREEEEELSGIRPQSEGLCDTKEDWRVAGGRRAGETG
jgi:hypothetical protein